MSGTAAGLTVHEYEIRYTETAVMGVKDCR
jgi:hypothetical protein